MVFFQKSIKVYFKKNMDLSIPEIKYNTSLSPAWQTDFALKIGCKKIDDKRIKFPKHMADGYSYFMEISPYISVHVFDLTLCKPLRLTSTPSDENFWIVHYDMSDSFNKHFVDNVKHKIGYKSKLCFAIIDNHLQSTYVAPVGERAYSLRLHIRKSFLKNQFKDAVIGKDFRDVFENRKKKMFYYGHIDSRSKVELHNLKQQSMDNLNYEFVLKSTAFKIFGYLIERLNSNMPKTGMFLQKDLDALMKAQEYLLSNLLRPFPGVKKLSEVANMSVSKYTGLYLHVFGRSAVSFFRDEKLLLAKELLESGEFELISDVAFELGYYKTPYFSIVYKKYHGELPNVVFRSRA